MCVFPKLLEFLKLIQTIITFKFFYATSPSEHINPMKTKTFESAFVEIFILSLSSSDSHSWKKWDLKHVSAFTNISKKTGLNESEN